MTEAINPQASMHPSSGAISGEIITSPIDLTGIRNVTISSEPITSFTDKPRNPGRRTGLRATLAFGTALAVGSAGFGAVGAQSPEPSFGPGTSPSASEEPITGAIDPCASPEPSPSPSPTPEPTPVIGEVRPNSGVLFGFTNSQGQAVEVSIFGQEAPSAAPSAPVEPEESFLPMEGFDVNGDGVIDERDDTNGDGVIDENDGQIAAIDCTPASPEPTEIDTSITVILEGNYEKIDIEDYKKIAKKAAVEISEFFVENGIIPDDTAEAEFNFYVKQFNQIKKNSAFEASGKTLANNIVYEVANAQYAAENGDYEAEVAFMEMAIADYRVGITFLKTDELADTFNRNVFDKAIKKVYKEYVKKGIIK